MYGMSSTLIKLKTSKIFLIQNLFLINLFDLGRVNWCNTWLNFFGLLVIGFKLTMLNVKNIILPTCLNIVVTMEKMKLNELTKIWLLWIFVKMIATFEEKSAYQNCYITFSIKMQFSLNWIKL